MPEEAAVDRGLYIRCPSCQGAELRPACEECRGAGFIPTGMTMGMLSRIMGHAKELAQERVARWRSGRGSNGHR
jgi:hypothetical protein